MPKPSKVHRVLRENRCANRDTLFSLLVDVLAEGNTDESMSQIPPNLREDFRKWILDRPSSGGISIPFTLSPHSQHRLEQTIAMVRAWFDGEAEDSDSPSRGD